MKRRRSTENPLPGELRAVRHLLAVSEEMSAKFHRDVATLEAAIDDYERKLDAVKRNIRELRQSCRRESSLAPKRRRPHGRKRSSRR